jgi:RNA ligase, T4 rnlA family|uniref:RNA ligase n=1 Tax=Myoviridae sp. ctCo31 TaxID=2825053 RepID=A0A8S5ULS3_9CAUD|nr:MAG TPA: RNA ligase [Myoviridae sp. ctCo31]
MQLTKKDQKTIKSLFDNLMNLCSDDSNTFFFVDATSSMQSKFRIFSYYIASYSEWLKPDALECRGIMFELDDNNNPIRIAARPPKKFFNLFENPFTEDIKDDQVGLAFKKEDGSLISSFIDKGELFLKSKGSLFSQQVLDAQKWLYDERRKPLLECLKWYAENGITINMEWVSPDNRVVLTYEEPRLIILNARHIITGEYIDLEDLVKDQTINQYMVDNHPFETINELIKEVQELKDQEGYVVYNSKGAEPVFKIKCPWYVHLHSVKSSVSSDKNLWEAVAEGVSDDIKALFETDKASLDRIAKFESIYKKQFSFVYKTAIDIYNKLRGNSRKDYAIESQSILNEIGYPQLFNIVMRLYLNGPDESIVGLIKDHLVKFIDVYLEL